MRVRIDGTFEDWREHARAFASAGVSPSQITWHDPWMGESLFSDEPVTIDARGTLAVPREFVEAARAVACHREEMRWDLMYRLLFRLTHGEPRLLDVDVDEDVFRFKAMHKAVRRDAHKMHAFVRFRQVVDEQGREHFVAFHRPDHRIARFTASFFRERFREMRWTIMTPDESVNWDGSQLSYGPGVEMPSVTGDPLEELWKTYYANIFNPARIKLKAMVREMPVRHWRTLPETAAIGEMLMKAPKRVELMVAATKNAKTAADFLPAGAGRLKLPVLHEAAEHCRGCELYKNATQVVFGEGPKAARIMMVGEQPGDQEDRAGKPFVGPAGHVLDEIIVEAGLDRTTVYVTNAVKHFKWTPDPRGKRRLHAKPTYKEVVACRPWLLSEIDAVKPEWIVLMGATAAQSLLGAAFRISKDRGKVFESAYAKKTIATWHPSAILRVPEPSQREQMRAEMIHDLKLIRDGA